MGKRMIMMPSSTRIRSAHQMDDNGSTSSTRKRGATVGVGGHDEMGSSSPLLLDERISLAPMMEYTDRYDGKCGRISLKIYGR